MRSMWEVYISVQVGPSHEEPFPLRTARQANVILTFGGPAWTVLKSALLFAILNGIRVSLGVFRL